MLQTGESSQVGLDVAAIGGMYANSMYLVGTNDGLGVNNQGVLSAQNKLTIDSTGKLQKYRYDSCYRCQYYKQKKYR